ncbi:NAD-glutamate dehydrogenase [Pseudonocardia eucalypti]|uniref:NAD-glutamate dehydrogenase n=1 Tax=Pseudonocardia eucalypti TaxID=648755 RepID=A0ABP9PQE5_9PSEU|nr:glutamate dehydrogenase [Pseudonocardia eucalypti]
MRNPSWLAELHRLYLEHASPDGLGVRGPAEAEAALRRAAGAAAALAAERVPGRPLLLVGEAAGDRRGTVVQIVTDDMPYLVESVLAGIGRVGGRVRRVIDPAVPVRRTLAGELTQVLAGPDAARAEVVERWIHVELDPFPADEADDLGDELRGVLTDVRDTVHDRDRMIAAALEVAGELAAASAGRASTEPGKAAELGEAAELLRWLADGHSTFLGYRRYRVHPGNGYPRVRAELASGLGVLRGDSLRSRPPSDAPAPDMDGAGDGNGAGYRALVLTRAGLPSRVLRPVFPYQLGIAITDGAGRVVGEHRFLGLLTVAALRADVLDIPSVRGRVRAALHRAGHPLESYAGQRMLEVISEYPREELFWASERGLREVATGMLSPTQPRRLRLFLRREPYRRFFSCLVYLPRDRYSTRTRLAMQQVLLRELGGRRIEYTARIGESSLALVHFTVLTDPETPPPDQQRLQAQLAAAILTWDDWALDVAGAGEPDLVDYLAGLPDGYKDDVDPLRALADLRRVRALGGAGASDLVLEPGTEPGEFRFRLFLTGSGVTLSSVLPVLQSLGVEVLDEHPYEILRPDGRSCWIYDFGLRVDPATALTLSGQAGARREFCAAFLAAWRGDAEVDRFNALVPRVGLRWREAALLRAYAGYARQLGGPFGPDYVADTLIEHAGVSRALLRLFAARFDPAAAPGTRADALEEASALVDAVAGLDADRILRGYLGAITATLRTNYYRDRPFLSFKIDPAGVPEMPAPRPRFEIFVDSPRVRGVHLRFGPVARGGLRWSDRAADFRTEILGLVKAQAVKNAVIVPVGAKGGFVVTAPDPGPDEVTACYRTFISALLDVTDNRVDGRVAPPPGVVRHDGDDSYLVVAADKGTARMSDVANALAVERGFWLGDAFASGGSVGYDHKAMGITARGAWESVKRHFRELGVDTQSQEFTAVGVGDMSGDVFGNGMLLSEHVRLVAAFDHRHVFLDPTPDPATSYAERRRLFRLPRSSWDDYDRALISPGGGVWGRAVKSVPIGKEARAALGLADEVTRLSPPELVRAILLAPADLLWNGGIGTYVKASAETHAEAGDKANDAVRVNGAQLRVRVVGEGGNLGLTQAGRIEFARAGGKVNTDALDNSAGVDCSDHEVNIKILLDRLMRAGALGREDRDGLLRAMTDDVGALVLADNISQNATLGLSRSQAAETAGVHGRMVADLEARRGLDRALELLPDAAGFAALEAAGEGLTSPELATLLAHVKLDLKASVLESGLPDLPELADRLTGYFPAALTDRFADALAGHPLRREIVATVLVNEVVDGAGTSFAFRLAEDLGVGAEDAVRAFCVATGVFGLRRFWSDVTALGPAVPTGVSDGMVRDSRRLLDGAARWLLTRRPLPLAIAGEVGRLGPEISVLLARLPELLRGRDAEQVRRRAAELVADGVPADLARRASVLPRAAGLLDVVDVAGQPGRARLPVEDVAELYFTLSERQDDHGSRR